MSTAATELDTPPASPVWRQCSEREEGRPRTARRRTQTSSSCGARTPETRTPSSSTTRCVEAYTLKRAEAETGVPAEAIKQVALEYAKAERGMICWTLGITEHHNAVDN